VVLKMRNSKAKNIDVSLGSYYASHRASAILSSDKDREIGKVIAEYKDKLIVLDGKFILDGEFKREHVYFIPKIRIDHYGDKRVYINISEESLKEFEI
jgi:hypothetical protein